MERGLRPRVVLGLVAGAAGVVGVGWAAGVGLGFGGFAFAWATHFAMMLWMAAALEATRPALDADWFRVRPWEPRIYRRLGVIAYMRLLRRVGWERAMRASRSFDGTRSSLPAFERDTRTSEFAHLVLAVVGLGMVLVAAAFRAWDAVGWLSVVTVALHVYPVLLQRVMRDRVQRAAHASARPPGR